MTNKRTITVFWLVAVAVIIALAVRHCSGDRPARLTALAPDARDSLLRVDVEGAQVMPYAGFTVWFDSVRHVPACVTYELTRQELDGSLPRTDAFAADPRVKGCPAPDAYAGTGLHRGHMAPASDMAWSAAAMRESFLMTNVCPQHRALNEGGWARLEEKCREWVRRDSALIIATGPVLEAGLDSIAGSGVVIPRRFFKVILAPCVRPRRAIAFVYGNGPCNGNLDRYVVTIDEVERLTGIRFFASLPIDEQLRIKSARNLLVWTH
ncbi:MAG: DNA/RNA non-specific endonuclease [Muribaculaceae bacterium]|nr:DNA/RNA non-specific endonuclease [Muribaculaceae bacterium]